MSRIYELSENDRDVLRESLQLVGMTQKEIAQRAGVTQGWISQILSGSRPSGDPTKFITVLEVINQLLQPGETNNVFSQKQVNEITRGIERLISIFRPAEYCVVSPPGGAVPLNALNYIERSADNEVIDWLKKLDFTMVVEGPLHCGKTSLLGRMAAEAESTGIDVTMFDCKLAAEPRLGDVQHDTKLKVSSPNYSRMVKGMDRLASLLVDHMILNWKIKPPSLPVSGANFSSWLQLALEANPRRRRLLILDDIPALAPDVVGQLLRVVRALHNDRSQGKMPISMTIGLRYDSWPVYNIIQESSTLAISNPIVNVGWLSLENVRKLVQVICNDEGLDVTDTLIKTLYDNYGGQPFLTHIAAAQTLGERKDPEEVFQKALNSEGQFEYHVRGICKMLIDAGGKTSAFDVFQRVSKGESISFNHWREDHRFLLDTSLLIEGKGSGRKLHVASRFYQEIASRIEASLEVGE